MRVLLIADWNLLEGGAEAYVLTLCDALAEAGDEVRLLTANVSPRARQVADHLAPASEHPFAKAVLQVANPFAAAAVRQAVRDFQPQVALVNMFALYLSPSAIFALGDVPYLLLVSDYKCICPLGHRLLPDASVCHHPVGAACLRNRCLTLPHWLREQVRYHRIDEVTRRAALVVSISDSLRGSLAEQGIASHPVLLFSDPPVVPLAHSPDAAPLFLYVGRLDIEKGVDILLHALALVRDRLPACRLRIVGQGAERSSLERLATRLGLHACVTFCGWREPRDIEAELSHAWALVAPSRWPEPFGLVALEAIFRGVPAIVPALGGFAETVEHGATGLMFTPGDAVSLSEQLLDIASARTFPHRTLAPDAVASARQRFSRTRHVERLRALMREVVPGE